MLDTYPRRPDHETTPGFATHTTHSGTVAVVAVAGELDLAAAPGFQREVLALLALPLRGVVLDLADLSFLDSSGLNALTRVHASAADHGVTLTLRRVPDQARRVLDLTSLTELFTFE